MEIIGWHGGWGDFDVINEQNYGLGDGQAQGWGFYIAKNREGGEYFAKTFYFRKKLGFLYKVKLIISENEFWEDADRNDFQLKNGTKLSYLEYSNIRYKYGEIDAAKDLIINGIKAFSIWENTQPDHGMTIVVLDSNCITLLEKYEYIKDEYKSAWRECTL